MKILKNLALIAFVGTLFVTWGCGDDGGDVPVKQVEPTDTTGNNDTLGKISSTVTVGFVKYELVTNDQLTEGFHRPTPDETQIFVQGQTNSGTPLQVDITFPGSTTGTFTQADMHAIRARVDVEAPGSVKFKQYDTDTDSKLTVTITEYGAIGERIKGTFSGKLKDNLNGVDVSGDFDVKRTADQ